MDINTKSNLTKLSWLSYSLTCVTGIAVVLPFVITQPAADYFKSDLGYIGFVFSFFMFGMLIFQFLNGYIVNFMSVRKEIYIGAVIYILCTTAMFFIHTAELLIPILILLGFCFGVIVTIPNFLIVHSFEGKDLSAKLNQLDLWFSIGSLVYPMIAGWMVEKYFSWQAVYFSVIIIFAVIVFLCTRAVLPNVSEEKSPTQKFSKWNINVWLVGIAIFFYFMSYIGYTYWVAAYLTKYQHLSESASDFGVTLFWIMYAVGCFISSFAVRFIKVNKYIIISAIISLAAYFIINHSTTVMMMYIAISILGLGCATIYSSSISYATLLVEHPSPRIVSFIITSSGVGTYLGQVYSSWVQTHWGIPAITMISAVFMAITIVCYLIIAFNDKIAIKHI